MLASTVTVVPTRRPTTTVRGEDRTRLRKVDPERDEERVEALPDAEPEKQADHRREQADHEAFDDDRPQHLTPRAAEGSHRGELRVRCATVIDSVLKITNAPTKSATPPNPSRK